MDQLTRYAWPGNVRELRNVIECSVITCLGSVLRLPEALASGAVVPEETAASKPLRTLEEVEREHIRRALESKGWRISGDKGAARVLGLNPSTLRFRMKKLGIRKTGYIDLQV